MSLTRRRRDGGGNSSEESARSLVNLASYGSVSGNPRSGKRISSKNNSIKLLIINGINKIIENLNDTL